MRFRLRFPKSDVAEWASRYGQDLDDDTPFHIGKVARERGYLDYYEFLEMARWKTPRSQPLCAKNDERYVEEISRIALATKNEQVAIEVLTLLKGVSWPTASVILHFCAKQPYPILDFRALWSLSIPITDADYDFKLWSGYVGITRRLASEMRVDMRTLDRALWAYSKHRQRSGA